MHKSISFGLVAESYTVDAIGQRVPLLIRRRVFGRTDSVSRAEWSAAGQMGLQPSLVIHMFGPDYQGEKIAHLWDRDGHVRAYGIYRTYSRRNDDLELYLEYKPGERVDEEEILRPLVLDDMRALLDEDRRLLVIRDGD